MRWDSASGQYDMGFRNYAPGLNQFLTRDMYNGALADMRLTTDPFTGNRYTFGAGNPVSNIEIDGHTQCDAGYCPTQSQTQQVTKRQNATFNPYQPVLTNPRGIPAAIRAPNEAVLERALAAAREAFEHDYWPAPDLAGCSAGPGGPVNLLACGSNGALQRVILLQYVCAQHGISCAGPAAHGNPLGYTLAAGAAAGMMFGGGGPRGQQSADVVPPRFITTGGGVTIDRLAVNTSISAQRQGRHVLGARQYAGGSYFMSADDAQRVLDDFHSGAAEILGVKGNDIVIRTPNVTGFNVNLGAGFPNQATNVFFIKGTRSPSVVPYNPAWTP